MENTDLDWVLTTMEFNDEEKDMAKAALGTLRRVRTVKETTL